MSSVTAKIAHALVLSGCLSAGAAAEERESKLLEQITVFGQRITEETESYVARSAATATKSDTPLKEIPLSISAVTLGLIEDQRPVLWGDALRNVAGYQPQTGFGVLNSRPRIRGFTPTQTLRNGFRVSGRPTLSMPARGDCASSSSRPVSRRRIICAA